MKTNFIFFDCWDTLIEYHEREVSIFDGLNKYLLNERNEKANVDEIKYFLSIKEKIFNNYFSQNNLFTVERNHLLNKLFLFAWSAIKIAL